MTALYTLIKNKGTELLWAEMRLKQLIQCTNSSPLSDCTPSICRSNSSTYRNLFTFKAPFTMGNKVATCAQSSQYYNRMSKPVKTYAWIRIFLCVCYIVWQRHILLKVAWYRCTLKNSRTTIILTT
jgi:hypothetical protein